MINTGGYRYRSLFWPGVLILVGVIALLVNSGVLSTDRLYALQDMWPLILIVIGLELIVRRAVQGRSGEVAAVLIVVVAIAAAVGYVAVAPSTGATKVLTASAPAGNLKQASVEIDVGAATVTVSGSSSLDGDLYRAHIEYVGAKPDIALNQDTGDLRISQSSSFATFLRNQRFTLNLELSSNVTWAIAANSGAATNTFNLGGAQIKSMQLNTGASRNEITLGAPSGIVPVTINGGALTVNVHRPSGVAASVAVSGGAVSLEADGRQSHTIGNASYDSPGFGNATDAYRIEVSGGACTVTLNTTSPG